MPSAVTRVAEDPAVVVAWTGRDLDGGNGNLSLIVGDGDVAAARRAALDLVGADPGQAVFMQQVHGGAVARVGPAHAGRGHAGHDDAVAAVDALVTGAADLALVVLVADCVPVVLVDPGRDVAAVHAGRGGVIAGVVPAALAAMAPQAPGDVVAMIGPAIGGCCYEIPADIAAAVTDRWPAAAATTTWGTPSLDLPSAVEAQLRDGGVQRVERFGGCTRCSGDEWFSHRAATAGAAPHGRQAAIVLRTTPGAAAPPRGAPDSSLESS